jgi:hypothetical protein
MTGLQARVFVGEVAGGLVDERIDDVAGRFIVRQERFDFRPQRDVAAARVRQPDGPFGTFEIDDLVEDLTGAFPASCVRPDLQVDALCQSLMGTSLLNRIRGRPGVDRTDVGHVARTPGSEPRRV